MRPRSVSSAMRPRSASSSGGAALTSRRARHVVEQPIRVRERVVLGEVALGLVARRAGERHVERDEAGVLLVACARRRGGSGSGSDCGSGPGSVPAPAPAPPRRAVPRTLVSLLDLALSTRSDVPHLAFESAQLGGQPPGVLTRRSSVRPARPASRDPLEQLAGRRRDAIDVSRPPSRLRARCSARRLGRLDDALDLAEAADATG